MDHPVIKPRARIGVIIPSSNRMAEPNFQRFAPKGVVPHFMRLRMSGDKRGEFNSFIARLGEAAAVLGDSKCDLTLLQCTGTSMSGGYGGEKTMKDAIEGATGRPALTTADCLMMAFDALGVRRFVFISENHPEGYEEKKQFLLDAGYEILGGSGAGLVSDQSCTTPPAFWADLARQHRDDRADAYFISCANIQAIDTIEELEEELGRPVLTSNQVALWASVRKIGIDDPMPGLGRLGASRLAETQPA